MHPDQANISGSHTDLYGSLAVVSLISCLGCVMFGTFLTSQTAKVGGAKDASALKHFGFLTERPVSASMDLVVASVWLSGTCVAGAVCVNTWQVLGPRSF